MDERRDHETLEDIASSLRRIAAALEAMAGQPTAPGARASGVASTNDEPTLAPVGARPAGATAAEGAEGAPRGSRDDGTEPSGEARAHPEMAAEADRRELLREFLAKRGVTIKHERERDEADEVLDRLALFMGSRFQRIQRFYERLKRHLGDGRPFTLNLCNEPQEVVSSTCQLATELHTLALLEEYHYRRSPEYLLRARPSRQPRAINFLTGGWLERYGVAQLIGAARGIDPAARCSYLKNPQIVLPNGDDFELDVLFEVEGEIYWLELKTGDYQRHIAKYAKVSRVLGLPFHRAYMVLTDIPRASATSLSALFGMSVTTSDDLGAALAASMAAHLRAPCRTAAPEQAPRQ